MVPCPTPQRWDDDGPLGGGEDDGGEGAGWEGFAGAGGRVAPVVAPPRRRILPRMDPDVILELTQVRPSHCSPLVLCVDFYATTLWKCVRTS